MAKALIVFGTSTGNTEEMSGMIMEALRKSGIETEMKNVEQASVSDLTAGHDLVLGTRRETFHRRFESRRQSGGFLGRNPRMGRIHSQGTGIAPNGLFFMTNLFLDNHIRQGRKKWENREFFGLSEALF